MIKDVWTSNIIGKILMVVEISMIRNTSLMRSALKRQR